VTGATRVHQIEYAGPIRRPCFTV